MFQNLPYVDKDHFFILDPNELLYDNYVWENDPMYSVYPTKWCQTDSPMTYAKNLERLGPNWHYATKSVEYKFNRHGYRTNEWESIDWAQSVVLFGCSLVLGIGVNEDETVGYHLSKMLGRPVINLGIGGSSIAMSLFNSMLMMERKPTPWGVGFLWTEPSRLVEFTDSKLINWGIWHLDLNTDGGRKNYGKSNIIRYWNSYDENSSLHSYFLTRAAKASWAARTRYCESTFLLSTKEKLQLDTYLNYDQQARDCIHPGPDCNFQMANILAGQLL